MDLPDRDARPTVAASRCMIGALTLAAFAFAMTAEAGAMRGRPAVKARVTTQQKWDAYWRKALRRHTMNVHYPGVHPRRVLALSANGSVSATPFLEYMRWRRSLNPKQFDGNHRDIARVLRRIKPDPIPPIPTPQGPVVGPIPIEPPDFVPVAPGFVNPPQVPEPSSGLVAMGLVGSVWAARRWSKSRRS